MQGNQEVHKDIRLVCLFQVPGSGVLQKSEPRPECPWAADRGGEGGGPPDITWSPHTPAADRGHPTGTPRIRENLRRKTRQSMLILVEKSSKCVVLY